MLRYSSSWAWTGLLTVSQCAAAQSTHSVNVQQCRLRVPSPHISRLLSLHEDCIVGLTSWLPHSDDENELAILEFIHALVCPLLLMLGREFNCKLDSSTYEENSDHDVLPHR